MFYILVVSGLMGLKLTEVQGSPTLIAVHSIPVGTYDDVIDLKLAVHLLYHKYKSHIHLITYQNGQNMTTTDALVLLANLTSGDYRLNQLPLTVYWVQQSEDPEALQKVVRLFHMLDLRIAPSEAAALESIALHAAIE
jgi:hypothetical protein